MNRIVLFAIAFQMLFSPMSLTYAQETQEYQENQDIKDINPMMQALMDSMNAPLKQINRFGKVYIMFSGSVEKIDLNREAISDFAKLRFKNSLAPVPYKDTPTAPGMGKEWDSKTGAILCNVWTVGTSYPIAHSVKCGVSIPGLLADKIIWQDEILGYTGKTKIEDHIKLLLGKIIDRFAITFFKVRGEM